MKDFFSRLLERPQLHERDLLWGRSIGRALSERGQLIRMPVVRELSEAFDNFDHVSFNRA